MLMLEKVMTALVDPMIPAPPYSALLEATVAAVYAQLRTSIEIELDDARMAQDDTLDESDYFDVRMEILAAIEEPINTDEPIQEPPDDGWPTILCDEIDEWDLAIESLKAEQGTHVKKAEQGDTRKKRSKGTHVNAGGGWCGWCPSF